MSDLSLDAVLSFSALWDAAGRAARGHRFRSSVAQYRLDLETHVSELHASLLAGTWRPSPVTILRIRDPKPRTIAVPAFADRIVHHAIAAVLEPIHDRRAIVDSYACRRGRGTHAALRRATAWSRTYRWWVRLDVEQFFPTIDHAIVRKQLARDLPAGGLRDVCELILAAGGVAGVCHFAGDDLFSPLARMVGLPLGSLVSQLLANRYLDPIDHVVKDRLRHRAYLRYMDDMLLFHDDRDVLERTAERIEAECEAVRLRLHAWAVQPTRGGVGFVGYRIMPSHVRVRRSSVNRAVRRLRWQRRVCAGLRDDSFRSGLRAIFSHWSHADSWRLRTKVLRRLDLLATDRSE